MNCIYGKSCESVRKRCNIKLINHKKVHQRCVRKPNFISSGVINKNLVAVHCSKSVLVLNKPLYVGFCILELSKLKMYQFHYDWTLKTFKDVKLLFTDTDNLVYEIRGGNAFYACYKDKHLSDFSRYPRDSKYFDDSNKKNSRKDKR